MRYFASKVIFQKDINWLHGNVLKMNGIVFLVMCYLGSSGAFWVGPGKWVNIEDLEVSLAHKGSGKGIVQYHSLKRKRDFGELSNLPSLYIKSLPSKVKIAKKFFCSFCFAKKGLLNPPLFSKTVRKSQSTWTR